MPVFTYLVGEFSVNEVVKWAWNCEFWAHQIQNFLRQGGAAPLQPSPGGQPSGPPCHFLNTLSSQGIGHSHGPYKLRKRISRRNFLTKLGIYQDYSKALIFTKEKLKNDVRVRKERRNINFHVASFWRNNDHFDFAFSLYCIGALKILTGNNFVLRINQIRVIYSKQKIGCFIHFSIFPSTFPTAVFPISASKWLMKH